MREYLERK